MKMIYIVVCFMALAGCSEHVPGYLIDKAYSACSSKGLKVESLWVYDSYGTTVKVKCSDGQLYVF